MKIKNVFFAFFFCLLGTSLLAEVQFSLICDKYKFIDINRKVYSVAHGHTFDEGEKTIVLYKKGDKFFLENDMNIFNKQVKFFSETESKYFIDMELYEANVPQHNMLTVNRYSGILDHWRIFRDAKSKIYPVEDNFYECIKSERMF